jgi:hypothetical protein
MGGMRLPPTRILPVVPLLSLVTLILACSQGKAASEPAAIIETAAPGSAAVTAAPQASATPGPASTQPQPTPLPPTQAPPTQPPPTATPARGLQFKPPQISQGGVAFVYLNEQATSATMTFQGRQYPMLHDGTRWWAIIGVGAWLATGLYPVSVSYTPAGQTAVTSIVASLAVIDAEFVTRSIELDSSNAALLDAAIIQAELAQRAQIYSGYTAQRFWSGPFIAPVTAPVSSAYGEGSSYNGSPVTDYHRGTDFAANMGDTIVASAAGRVVFAGALRVRGNAVIIDHGAGLFTAYHHMSAIHVAEGQVVSAGMPIGAVGSTGLATGPHLHWEVIVRSVEVDGESWLKGQEVGP